MTTKLLFLIALIPLLITPLAIAQNQTNTTTHLRHFHLLSTVEKTKLKLDCLKQELHQALIIGVTKNYIMINDSASTQLACSTIDIDSVLFLL